MNLSLGKKIKELRKAHGLSQEHLAEQMDVSRQSISKWENDLSEPSAENLFQLADVFNVSVAELRDPNAKVAFALNTKKNTVSMKKSKPFILFVALSFIGFIVLFFLGVYANAAGVYGGQIVFYLMMASAMCMLCAFVPIYTSILQFVYKDCKQNGIKPAFWVFASTTFIGLAYYLMKRDRLVRK